MAERRDQRGRCLPARKGRPPSTGTVDGILGRMKGRTRSAAGNEMPVTLEEESKRLYFKGL